MLTVEKGGYSERFCVCLWPMFSVLLSAFSVKAPWRLHALLYGEHWIILLVFLHHYRFVITVKKSLNSILLWMKGFSLMF